MTERRIADIMQQPRALKDIAEIHGIGWFKLRITDLLQDLLGDILPKRLPVRGYLQRMRQSGADKVALIQWKDLCLILKPSEGSALDNTVIVLLKLRPKITIIFRPIAPYPVVTEQLTPSHVSSYKTLRTVRISL